MLHVVFTQLLHTYMHINNIVQNGGCGKVLWKNIFFFLVAIYDLKHRKIILFGSLTNTIVKFELVILLNSTSYNAKLNIIQNNPFAYK